MAKRKHAAALFEVFHNSNKPTSRPAPSAPSRGYGWWFKGRIPSAADADEPQAFDENDPTTMTIRSPLLAPRIAAVEAMEPPAAPVKPEPPKLKIKPAAVFKPEPPVESPEPAVPIREPADRAEAYDGPARFHLDRERREITLRLPFNGALIAACGLFLCVGVAYVAGRHIGSKEKAGPAVATAPVDQARPEVRSSVLEVPRHPSRVATATPAAAPINRVAPRPTIADESRYHDRDSAPMANNVHGLTSLTPQTQATVGPRIIGLNYVLIQNYPNKESAAEARDFLVQNGIDCTIEKVPSGYLNDPTWVSVISTRGFTREELHAAEYTAFRKKIEKASEKFAGSGKFKRFAILTYQLK
ncbi:MAG TPA: hypothetical protein VFE47_02820 [Tepidisphaeraceae bacterium]|jgi:hypothetical protein|nr:hypothetical protein [Tepidisphaeraceae bacterium]